MTDIEAAPILLVEDTASLARVYIAYLAKVSLPVRHVETGAAALDMLRTQPPPVVLLDLHLPDMDGMEILRFAEQEELPVAIVVITAHGSINVAVEAMQHGAYDFIVKPFSADRLTVTVRNALERMRLARIVESYRDEGAPGRYEGFIGSSLAMQSVYRIIDSAAASKATVFITGESGTGKEVCAEAIHRRSPRRDRPFVALNCGAIPKELVESELFGHVRGAFTGAVTDREGAAARAAGGTLFLDEICELELGVQTKLLRFIQTGTFQKVGGSRTESVDLRILCATNRDPLTEVEAGRFREDLYYRLHVIPLHLPPLREREDDAVEIARQFLMDFAAEEGKLFARFDPAAETLLRSYAWPGNVRQLQNMIRQIVVLQSGETVTAEMLPPPIGQGPHGALPGRPAATAPASRQPAAAELSDRPADAQERPDPGRIRPLWQVEKEAIERAIAAADGNIPRAAAWLGISASTIYRKRLAWEADRTS
ncbi:MAG: response regulator [Alphaproteobacteria bacterium]|jgi:DNA-binding NtrC family response regulator|nr:response regulator [Alphaproteobacteria bacterium]